MIGRPQGAPVLPKAQEAAKHGQMAPEAAKRANSAFTIVCCLNVACMSVDYGGGVINPSLILGKVDDQCYHPSTILYRKFIELRNFKFKVF